MAAAVLVTAAAATVLLIGMLHMVVADAGAPSSTCPNVPGKQPATAGAVCGHDLMFTGPGGPDIVSLPPGASPCPSVPGKAPSSATASCTAGPPPSFAPDIVTLPPGTSPCPSLPGKPSSPNATCSGFSSEP
jgi:hypothetical protein